MRRSQQTAGEIEAADLAADGRKQSRATGFSMMEIRDRGWVRLQNGIIMNWPVTTPLAEGEARMTIPEGHFVLNIKGESFLFDADEFRKFVRWV